MASSDSESIATTPDSFPMGDEEETEEQYNESRNDYHRGRFYCEWANCQYKGAPMTKNMTERLNRCRAECIRRLEPLGHSYKIFMPDRIYALRSYQCFCGATIGSLQEVQNSICWCPRPEPKIERPWEEEPFTAIDIIIDCDNYEGIQEAYKVLGVREDNLSADDDRISIFCLRKAYYNSTMD